MSRNIVICLRVSQVLLALANLALSAFVINWFVDTARLPAPSPFNFFIFAPIFSLVSLVFLEAVPKYAPRASHPIASLVLELVNTVFYFAGFIALAIYLNHLLFCAGTVCAAGRADGVLSAAQFASWIATTIFQAKDLFKSGLRKPMEPAMREV